MTDEGESPPAGQVEGPRADLAEKIAGEITLSANPGGTLRKWREDFDVSQTVLADELEVSPSVVSDYESGRRESPGIAFVTRVVTALLDVDERRGGHHIRQHARALRAGFSGDAVLDLREYPSAVRLDRVHDAVGATEITAGSSDLVRGHTVIDSIEAITSLTGDEFYRLYGQSTSRVLVFTNVSRGESPLVVLRVVDPTPDAVLLHGLTPADLWEHAPALASIDGYSLAVTDRPLGDVLGALQDLE